MELLNISNQSVGAILQLEIVAWIKTKVVDCLSGSMHTLNASYVFKHLHRPSVPFIISD